MTEAEWLAGRDASSMIQRFWGRPELARKLRLLAVACCRLYWDKLPDEARAWVTLGEEVAERGLGEQHFLAQRRQAHSRAEKSGQRSLDLACEALATDPCVAAMNAEFTLRSTKRGRAVPQLVLDVFGNPFRPARVDPAWLAWNGGLVVRLAQGAYDERAFDRLPVLADALEEAGCPDEAILSHLRGPGPHVRGCWALDLILGKG